MDNANATTPKLTNPLPSLSPKGVRWLLFWLLLVFVVSLLQVMSGFFGWGMPVLVFRGVLWALFVVLAGVVLVSLGSLLILRSKTSFLNTIAIDRTIPTNLALYTPTPVILALSAEKHAPRWTALELYDVAPQGVVLSDMPYRFGDDELAQLGADDDAWSVLSVAYYLTANERGQFAFDSTDMRVYGAFGLWFDTYRLLSDMPTVVRVFANFKEIGKENLYAAANKTTVNGLIRERLRGNGQDFHQIRAYMQGDSLRQVDWRATARQRRLMSKEYQNEKEQTILFLLDSSQNMRHKRQVTVEHTDYFVSHLDTVLNAMLKLATVAIKQGDATGFVSFSGQDDVIAMPKKGVSAMNYLLNQSFLIDTSLKMPDYIGVAKMALNVLKKRSLVVLITSTRTQNAEELLTAVKLLHGKHLVVVANLYEQDLAKFVLTSPTDSTNAKTQFVVQEHLSRQRTLMSQLSGLANVSTIHCTPDKLANRLTQSYLQLKQRWGW